MCKLSHVIESFADKETERIYRGLMSRSFQPDIQRRALNKLRVLNAIVRIDELLNPPSNRLEALRGDKAGQFSIRINQQWRICFRWENGNAYNVSIEDYH
jgi:toxin HigB-1